MRSFHEGPEIGHGDLRGGQEEIADTHLVDGHLVLITLLGSSVAAETLEVTKDELLVRMHVLLRKGLYEIFHGNYDQAREHFLAAYKALLRFEREVRIQKPVIAVADAFGRLVTAHGELKRIVFLYGYEDLDNGSLPISVGDVHSKRDDFVLALDAVRKAMLAAPKWLLKERLKNYVQGMKSMADWAAAKKVEGQPLLADPKPYDFS